MSSTHYTLSLSDDERKLWKFQLQYAKLLQLPGADPGFPVGRGGGPVLGGVDLRQGCFLVKIHVKTKELSPVKGACAGKFCM